MDSGAPRNLEIAPRVAFSMRYARQMQSRHHDASSRITRGGRKLRACFIIGLSLQLSACASSVLLDPEHSRDRPWPELTADSRETLQRVELHNEAGNRLTMLVYEQPGDYGSVMVSGGDSMGRKTTSIYTQFLHNRGYRIIIFSFQGYDDNPGRAELKALPGDAASVYNEILSRYPGEPVVYLATSVSTAAALCLPAQAPPGPEGLILEAAMNVRTIAFATVSQPPLVWPLLPLTLPLAAGISVDVPNNLAPAACMAKAEQVPALFLHHPNDDIVPYKSALRLFESYPGEKWFYDFTLENHGTSHLLLNLDRGGQRAVLDFVRSVFE